MIMNSVQGCLTREAILGARFFEVASVLNPPCAIDAQRFKGMEYTEDYAKMKQWCPLMMEGRTPPAHAHRLGGIGTSITRQSDSPQVSRRLQDSEMNTSLVVLR